MAKKKVVGYLLSRGNDTQGNKRKGHEYTIYYDDGTSIVTKNKNLLNG